MAEALNSTVDILVNSKKCSGLSRPTLAFLATMMAHQHSIDLSITLDHVKTVADAVRTFVSSGTTAVKAVRMQGQFYSSYTAARRALEARANEKRTKLFNSEFEVQNIADESSRTGEVEFTRISSVYKHVLGYCSATCLSDAALSGLKPSKAMDLLQFIGAVQREFAAALESVLPKASLQGFVRMSRGERDAQMDEVAKVVVGIRLFNWESGKGGPGMEHTPSLSTGDTRTLASDVGQALQANQALCAQYIDVLAAVQAGNIAADAAQIASWSSELVNRRCACVLLAAVQEDAEQLQARAAQALSVYQQQLSELKRTVSGRGAVSKEDVYPRFTGMARAWLTCAECRTECAELSGVLDGLRPYIPGSSISTLPPALFTQVQRQGRDQPIFAPVSPLAEGEPAQRIDPREAEDSGLGLELGGLCPVALCTPVVAGGAAPAGAQQGGMGVAQTGDSQYGLYRFNDKLFAVSSEQAGAAFSLAPARYLSALGHLTTHGHPELVHVLELVSTTGPLMQHGAAFPRASLQLLASFDGDAVATAAAVAEQVGLVESQTQAELGLTAGSAMNQSQQLGSTTRLGATGRVSKKSGAALVDVCVETPVHFVERHIDPRYQFSEWALRRQAVKIANIRKCATHGAQTDASAFRRENDTQVYLPRESGTQTGISVGSNTDRVVRYVGGLRGYGEPLVDQAAVNVGKGLPALGETGSKTQPIPGPTAAMRISQATLEV